MSMRLEKNWGAWTLDYRPDFTAKETGLDNFINWNKDFIGKENAEKEKDKRVKKNCLLTINEIGRLDEGATPSTSTITTSMKHGGSTDEVVMGGVVGIDRC